LRLPPPINALFAVRIHGIHGVDFRKEEVYLGIFLYIPHYPSFLSRVSTEYTPEFLYRPRP
jgi:hypothetical protein